MSRSGLSRRKAATKKRKKQMWRQKREDTEKLLDPAWQAKYLKHLERYQHQAKEEARVRKKMHNYICKFHDPRFPPATKGE